MADISEESENMHSIHDMPKKIDKNLNDEHSEVSVVTSEDSDAENDSSEVEVSSKSCQEDLNSLDDSIEMPSSSIFVSAGQIRARCSSAKNSSHTKNLKDKTKAETSEFNSNNENPSKISLSKKQKPANLFKISPGLAQRLSENSVCNHDVINGNYKEDKVRDGTESEKNQIKADCESLCSKFTDVSESDVSDNLTNYESQLINKEREDKLEKIARIDLLYQRQIESEMNAGIETHFNENLNEETGLNPTSSSHVDVSSTPSINITSTKIKKPSSLLDASLIPKRKTPKPSRPVFSRFPGKTVNLPSVEDGLSSGNASGDDDVEEALRNIKINECMNSLDVESTRMDENIDFEKSESSTDSKVILHEEEKMEDNLEKLNLKQVNEDGDGVSKSADNSGESVVSVDNPSNDLEGSIDNHPDDNAKSFHNEIECVEDLNIDEKKSEVNANEVCDKDESVANMTKSNDIEVDDSIRDSTRDDTSFPMPSNVNNISEQGDRGIKPHTDTDLIVPTFDSTTTNSQSIVLSSAESSSITTASVNSSIETNIPMKYEVTDTDVDNPSNSFKSELTSTENKQNIKSEIKDAQKPSSAPSDVSQKYPNVPLPYIRMGSSCSSPPISLEAAHKPVPPQKIETEVFELRPILGISTEIPKLHRLPSPCIARFQPMHFEKLPSDLRHGTLPQSNPLVAPGKDLNSSADVEDAIRDIRSAILKSKKLSLPPQLVEELSANNQVEPVWITRQPPSHLGKSYGKGGVQTSSTATTKNFQGRQEYNCNTMKTSLPSDDEEDDGASKPEDDYYITKDLSEFSIRGTRLRQTTIPGPGAPHAGKSEATWEFSRPSAHSTLQHLPIQRLASDRFDGTLEEFHPPKYSSECEAEGCQCAEHTPYRCDRYDCHECRHLPDDFDDEDDDDEEEEDYDVEDDDDDNTRRVCHDDDEDDDDDDEEVETVNDYVRMKPGPGDLAHHHHHSVTTVGGICQHRGTEMTSPSMSYYGRGRSSGGGGVGSISRNNHDGCRGVGLKDVSKNSQKPLADKNGGGNPEYSTDEETDNLLKKQYNQEADETLKHHETPPSKQSQIEQRRNRAREVALRDPSNESVLIEGVLFRANYLGSTQLISEGQPSKSLRMMQAQEAVGRIKAPEGESQPSTEVDLFVSVEKIMVLNTNLQEIMMDHALRTISYIADIGDILVVMARRGSVVKNSNTGPRRTQTKICCHVFESEEAQLIAQSIGQAFQVSYVEFLKANGIEETSNVKNMDYQDVLNQQEVYGEELYMLSNKEMQREVIVSKVKGEQLGVVIVESGWGSLIPTVVLANMAPSGSAARCNQLNIGDQIISINGISMVGLPLTTCQSYIKAVKSQSIVKLTVVSCPPVVEVLIKRPDLKYQLGFSVQNGVICSLLRGGIAERGGVRVGHRIIEINGQSVVATHHEKIVNMLATSAGEIHMKTMPTSIFQLLTGQVVPHYI